VLPTILDATVILFFSGDLGGASATNTGNPFSFSTAAVTTADGWCGSEPLCAFFSGTDFGQDSLPNFGDSWLLGDLTLESNGGWVDLIVSSDSYFTPGRYNAPLSNIGEIVGTLPEPGALALLLVTIPLGLLRRLEFLRFP
jgi:hypothetical protein